MAMSSIVLSGYLSHSLSRGLFSSIRRAFQVNLGIGFTIFCWKVAVDSAYLLITKRIRTLQETPPGKTVVQRCSSDQESERISLVRFPCYSSQWGLIDFSIRSGIFNMIFSYSSPKYDPGSEDLVSLEAPPSSYVSLYSCNL